MSPYRVAANSQYQRALHWQEADSATRSVVVASPFQYLRFRAGAYGLKRLAQLADPNNSVADSAVRARADAAMAQTSEWQPPGLAKVDLERALSALPVFPSDRSIAPALHDALINDLLHPQAPPVLYTLDLVGGLFVDLNADGEDEFVLLTHGNLRVYQHVTAGWKFAGTMWTSRPAAGKNPKPDLIDKLKAGEIAVLSPRWSNLKIGNSTYRFSSDPDQITAPGYAIGIVSPGADTE
jgi:hypothetical protein